VPIEWGQVVVASTTELARRLDEPVWVPDEWPAAVGGPEYVVLLFPGGDERRNDYQLRGHDDLGRLLLVHGHRRQPGIHLESGLLMLESEPFVTLSRPEDQPVHMVVRTTIFDVHVSGDVLPYQDALSLAQGLIIVIA
jgi:hypothetical protein